MTLWHLPWILISQRKRTCFDLIRVLSFSFCVPCSVLQFQAVSSVGWTWKIFIEPVGQQRRSPPRDHPEIRKVLLMKLGAAVRAVAALAASAGAARAGCRRGPSESPQPGAIPTRARSSRLKAMGKPEICREDTHGSHVSLHCFLWKDQLRNPPKTLDSVDSFDRKLALSYCQGFCFWGSMWHVVGRLNFSKFC